MWSNGTPSNTIEGIINGNYSVSANGNISTFKLTVISNKVLSVNSSGSVVATDIINNGQINNCGGTVSGTVTGNAVQDNTNPAITSQPADANVDTEQDAVFNVTATGGGLIYQWTEGGSNVGTGMASYAKTDAAISDNGKTYVVQVSNACGSVTSDTATLTVTLGYCRFRCYL